MTGNREAAPVVAWLACIGWETQRRHHATSRKAA
jgi:hypothetical protein